MSSYLNSSLINIAAILAVVSVWLWFIRRRITAAGDWFAARALVARERARAARIKNDTAAHELSLRQWAIGLERELHEARLRAEASLTTKEQAALVTRRAADQAEHEWQLLIVEAHRRHLSSISTQGGTRLTLDQFIAAMARGTR